MHLRPVPKAQVRDARPPSLRDVWTVHTPWSAGHCPPPGRLRILASGPHHRRDGYIEGAWCAPLHPRTSSPSDEAGRPSRWPGRPATTLKHPPHSSTPHTWVVAAEIVVTDSAAGIADFCGSFRARTDQCLRDSWRTIEESSPRRLQAGAWRGSAAGSVTVPRSGSRVRSRRTWRSFRGFCRCGRSGCVYRRDAVAPA